MKHDGIKKAEFVMQNYYAEAQNMIAKFKNSRYKDGLISLLNFLIKAKQ